MINKVLKQLKNHDLTGRGLYGDMILVVMGIALAPLYAWQVYRIPSSDEGTKAIALRVYAAMVFPICFTVPAVLTKNLWFSRLGMAGVLFFKAYANIMEWPHPGECTIAIMLPGSVAMSVLANVSLDFQEKMLRLAAIFLVGSYVSIQNPYSVYVEDTLPILGVTILLSIFGLYVYHFSVTPRHIGVRASRLVLAALFVYHTVMNLTSIPSSDKVGFVQISGLLKAVVIACVGGIATGNFQEEIEQKQQLEILVKERTKKLKLQNEELRMVSMALQASETAIAITDKPGNIIWINTAFEKMCHQKKKTSKEESLIGQLLKDVIYKLDPSQTGNRYILIDTFEDSMMKPSSENRNIRIENSIFQVETTPFASENYDDMEECNSKEEGSHDGTRRNGIPNCNKNNRFLMAFKDVTVERARERAERKAREEATVAKAMGESMVTLTHELRTPLQGIMGITSLLLDAQELTSDSHESLKLIMASSSLLLNLINNLLDVKKATAKMMEEFPLTAIAASGPIKDASGFCQPLASISNVEIVADLRSAKYAVVKSNALRLQQVLINLISNGIKHTNWGSKICIRIRPMTIVVAKRMVRNALASSSSYELNDSAASDDEKDEEKSSSSVLVFSISDSGPGIVPGEAGRLFRRFAQLEDREPRRTWGTNIVGQPTGTGLGLHLCQLFVERMNGQIWVTNNNTGNNAGGSTFSFYLPLVSNEDFSGNASGRLPASVAERRSCSDSNDSSRTNNDNDDGDGLEKAKNDEISTFERRVLLVDDVLINRKVFDRMLKTIGVSNSLTVESGKDALQELSKNRYDLVITDLQMPGMSGTELSLAINNAGNSEDDDEDEGFAFSASSVSLGSSKEVSSHLPPQQQSPTPNHDSRNLRPPEQQPRRRRRRCRLPVVVGLTADTSLDVTERCAASGMADVLHKPITLAEMKEYFETTIPRLQPGVWHHHAAAAD